MITAHGTHAGVSNNSGERRCLAAMAVVARRGGTGAPAGGGGQ